MELDNRAVVVYLSAGGYEELNFLFGLKDQDEGVGGLIRATDGFGIWLSVTGEPSSRTLIIPWHNVRALDLELEAEPGREEKRTIGFEP